MSEAITFVDRDVGCINILMIALTVADKNYDEMPLVIDIDSIKHEPDSRNAIYNGWDRIAKRISKAISRLKR